MIKFSVVIPVYNAERYLYRCLDSLHKQSYNNFQVIVIDDGSNDDSISIIREMAKKDSRFQYRSEKNNGPAFARTLGVKLSNGDYICFVDSDDEVSRDYFSTLDNIISSHSVDILEINATIIKENGDRKLLQKLNNGGKEMTGITFLTDYLKQYNYFNVVPWSKVVRRSYIVSNNLYFKKRYAEDELWSHEIYANAKKVMYCQNSIYIQHSHSGSLSNKKKKAEVSSVQDQKANCKELEKFYLRNVPKGKYLNILRSDLCHTYIAVSLLNTKLPITMDDKLFCLRNANTFSEIINATIFMLSPRLRSNLKKYLKG